MVVSITFGVEVPSAGFSLPVMQVSSYEEVANSGTSQQTTYVATGTGEVARICPSANIRLQVGANPTAGAADGMRIAADESAIIALPKGSKIAIINSTA